MKSSVPFIAHMHINGAFIVPLDVQKQCHEGLQWILGKTV